MPLTLIKPKGKKIPESLYKQIQDFYKKGEGIYCNDAGEWQLIKETPLPKSLEDFDYNNPNIEAYFTFYYTSTDYSGPFFHAFNDENERIIYCIAESAPVTGVVWGEIKNIIKALSYDGAIQYVRHLLQNGNKTLILVGSDHADIINPGDPSTDASVILPDKNNLIEREGVFYQGYLMGVSNQPQQQSSFNTGSNGLESRGNPTNKVAINLTEEHLSFDGLVLKRAGDGHKRYFRTECNVYVEGILPNYATTIADKIHPNDFIYSFAGVIHPTLEQIKAALNQPLLRRPFKILRWNDLDRSKQPIQLDRES